MYNNNILSLTITECVYSPTAKPADKVGICKVYYEEKAILEWQVMFTVVKNLDALQQVIISYFIDLHVLFYYSILKNIIVMLRKSRVFS